MSEIFRVDYHLHEPYRKTAKNTDVSSGWSKADDVTTRNRPSPTMAPSISSLDPENLSLTAPMGDALIAEHQNRAFHVHQYSEDFFDVYYDENEPIYAVPGFTDLIRRLDGDAHEYFGPVQIWSIPDQCLATQTYTGIWVRRLVPTIDVAQSRVDKITWHRSIKEPPNRKPYFYHLKALTPEGHVVYRDALDAGLSIWRDRDTRALFCTKAFRDQAADIGHRGIKFMECTVMDR